MMTSTAGSEYNFETITDDVKYDNTCIKTNTDDVYCDTITANIDDVNSCCR